ncbi:hypothetical protein [uncultured Photobacterium sp.]|uniref:hypothetical protein n=1 Tax=uncultured Photobacterium sp. TaxID=173973 RepID=UPI002617829B|nr:hypothetical protein [uncultured Photobacterium sp.]
MVTIFRTINGKVIPINVSEAYDYQPVRSLRKYDSSRLLDKKHYCTFEAFTIPNVRCPVCGQFVFYYEHPNGGRVYFEELGPPWLKHPCTSHEQPKKLKPGERESLRELQKVPRWKLENWQPFKIQKVKKVSVGTGLPKGIEVTVYSGDITAQFSLSSVKMRTMRVNYHSVKGLLVQGRLDDLGISFELHDGSKSHVVKGKVIHRKTPGMKLKSIEIELPNHDGHYAFLKGRVGRKEIFTIFDLSEMVYQKALDHLLLNKLNVYISQKETQSSKWFDIDFDLFNYNDHLCTFKNLKAYQRENYLSPSQKAKSIAQTKQKRGGNSCIADAFQKAFQNQS